MNEKRDHIRRLCEQRGIRIEQHGRAYRLRGPGIDLQVRDLAHIRPAELSRRQTVGLTAW